MTNGTSDTYGARLNAAMTDSTRAGSGSKTPSCRARQASGEAMPVPTAMYRTVWPAAAGWAAKMPELKVAGDRTGPSVPGRGAKGLGTVGSIGHRSSIPPAPDVQCMTSWPGSGG